MLSVEFHVYYTVLKERGGAMTMVHDACCVALCC